MYPVTSTQIAPRRDERRSHLRHRATSIMFAHLGSDNGGVVLNLGLDGVACQAAMKLMAQQNSTLNVHLRGSGLNVEVLGEIVWLGATQKEVGIRFKNASPSVLKEIAAWIDRETQPSEVSAAVEKPRAKPMTAMPTPISGPADRLVTHPLSAALAMSQEKFLDPAEAVHAKESQAAAPPEIVSPISSAAPRPEIVPPIRPREIPGDELDVPIQKEDIAVAPSSPVPSDIGQPWSGQPVSEPLPVEPPSRTPPTFASPTFFTRVPMPPAQEDQPAPAAKPTAAIEVRRADEIRAIVFRDRASTPPARLAPVTAAERWLPPAVLDVWKKSNHEQKLLLAGVGSACAGILVLLLITALIHIGTSFGRAAGSESSQPSMARSGGPSAGSPRATPLHAPVLPVTEDPDDPDQPPPSPMAYLAKIFLGEKPPRPDLPIEIDPEDVGVPVWTSKGSGYYYCTDTPYYLSVRPGTFMSQRDALQSGYQPKLGQFCN